MLAISYSDKDIPFLALFGKTLASVEGGEKGSGQIVFRCTDGSVYLMAHEQDCCESVRVEDVTGDWADVIGSPLTMADESSNRDEPKPDEYADSWTWTFYRLATIKGYVTIRWLGESNGYYSESVSFVQREAPTHAD